MLLGINAILFLTMHTSEIHQWHDGHFYSPIPDKEDVRQRRKSHILHKDIPGINLREQEQLQFLQQLAPLCREQPLPKTSEPNWHYNFEDGKNFSYADAIVLQAMLRFLRPQRCIEVGSGWSSCIFLDIQKHMFAHDCYYACIDPFPHTLQKVMNDIDRAHCDLYAQPVQDIPTALFEELQTGDILFIDSSHVCKAESDVHFLFTEALPRLRSGVHIHFHDIFHPFDYPLSWIEEGRSWNEAYVLHSFLQYNSRFEITLWNDFLFQFHCDAFLSSIPLAANNPGGSLWLQVQT